MANRTYLLGSDDTKLRIDAESSTNTFYLETSYCIPLLWLTLFVKKNIRFLQVVNEETGKEEKVPYLSSKTSEAQVHFQRRRPHLELILSSETLGQWALFLEVIIEKNILVDCTEMFEMEATQNMLDHLQAALHSLDEPTQFITSSLVWMTGFTFDPEKFWDKDQLNQHILGHSQGDPVPWENMVGFLEYKAKRLAQLTEFKNRFVYRKITSPSPAVIQALFESSHCPVAWVSPEGEVASVFSVPSVPVGWALQTKKRAKTVLKGIIITAIDAVANGWEITTEWVDPANQKLWETWLRIAQGLGHQSKRISGS